MPVHPEPAAGESATGLRRKDLREMIVLAAVCLISTIAFVTPMAGLASPANELVSRDLYININAPLAPVVVTRASRDTRNAAAQTVSHPRSQPPSLAFSRARVQRTSYTARANGAARVATLRGAERRTRGEKLTRVLVGDGRYRARPFPRPSEFEY